jgi:hypothetical protein
MNNNSTAGLIPQEIYFDGAKRDKRYDIRVILVGETYKIETRQECGVYHDWEIVTEKQRLGVWGCYRTKQVPAEYETQTEAIEAAQKLNRELNPEILLEI